MLLAAGAQPGRSWAGLLALAAAYVVFRVGTYVWVRLKRPSPTPAIEGARRVKVQATVGVTPDEPTGEPEVEPAWFGRIIERGGVRMRQVRQIVKTGSHELPAEDDEPEVDSDVDLALDDEPAEDEPDDGDEALEEYIARARRLRVPYNQIVKVAVATYGVSVSTAKRRIRELDEAARGGQAA